MSGFFKRRGPEGGAPGNHPRAAVRLLFIISLIELVPRGASGQPFGPPTQYATGPGTGEAAAGDLNGDGALDLVTSHSGSNSVSILLGDGSGAFLPPREYATGTGPLKVEVGDVNQDGILDVLTLDDASVSLLLGNGDGSFRERTDFPILTPYGQPRFFAVVDLNADSKLDVVVLAWDVLSVFLGNGDGTFGARMDGGADTMEYAAVGDMNGDSKPDLAYSHGGEIIVRFGNGDGSFRYGVSTPVRHPDAYPGGDPAIIGIGDFNGDAKLDLVTVVFNIHFLSVLLGNGDGTFGGLIDWGSG